MVLLPPFTVQEHGRGTGEGIATGGHGRGGGECGAQQLVRCVEADDTAVIGNAIRLLVVIVTIIDTHCRTWAGACLLSLLACILSPADPIKRNVVTGVQAWIRQLIHLTYRGFF